MIKKKKIAIKNQPHVPKTINKSKKNLKISLIKKKQRNKS